MEYQNVVFQGKGKARDPYITVKIDFVQFLRRVKVALDAQKMARWIFLAVTENT